jgi:hypothetical protein
MKTPNANTLFRQVILGWKTLKLIAINEILNHNLRHLKKENIHRFTRKNKKVVRINMLL